MARKKPQNRVKSSLSAHFLRRRMASGSRRGKRGKVALYSINKNVGHRISPVSDYEKRYKIKIKKQGR
jgi:hypothetical protein